MSSISDEFLFLVCTVPPDGLPLLLCLITPQGAASICSTTSCVPTHVVSLLHVQCELPMTYENETPHHVHAGAEAAEQHDLVRGDHPLAAGLSIACQHSALHSILLPISLCSPPPSASSPPSLPGLHWTAYAPSPRSSGHRASGTRAGSAAHGSRGRPSCVSSVLSSERARGSAQLPPPSRSRYRSLAASAASE